MASAKIVELATPTNGGRETIEASLPYTVTVALEGAADLLFHRWNAESVTAKGNAAKGSKAKKSDDIESYVYRNDSGEICIPGEYLRQAIVHAAKYRQDPRSPRKSAMDLYKAGVVCTTILAPIMVGGKTTKEWEYLDTRRVQVQRAGINRTRPAFRSGWNAEFQIMINLPEYIDRNSLRETIESAGRLIGLADFRPTYGRFGVVSFN